MGKGEWEFGNEWMREKNIGETGKVGGDFDKQTSRLASAPAVATDGSFLPQLLLLAAFWLFFPQKKRGAFFGGTTTGKYSA